MKESTQEFWKRVRKIESSLKESYPDGAVYLSTIAQDNGLPAGLIKIATPALAAEAIAKGQAQIASVEEVEQYRREQALESRRITAAQNRLVGQPVTVLQMTDQGAVFTEQRIEREIKRV